MPKNTLELWGGVECTPALGVINAAGVVRVADAAREREICLAANATGAQLVAEAARGSGSRW